MPERSAFGWVGLALVCLLLVSYAFQNGMRLKVAVQFGGGFQPNGDEFGILKTIVFFSILRVLIALATIALLVMRNDRTANYLGIVAILFCYPVSFVLEHGIEAWFFREPFHFSLMATSLLAATAACIYLLVSKDRAGVDLDAKVDRAMKFIRS